MTHILVFRFPCQTCVIFDDNNRYKLCICTKQNNTIRMHIDCEFLCIHGEFKNKENRIQMMGKQTISNIQSSL